MAPASFGGGIISFLLLICGVHRLVTFFSWFVALFLRSESFPPGKSCMKMSAHVSFLQPTKTTFFWLPPWVWGWQVFRSCLRSFPPCNNIAFKRNIYILSRDEKQAWKSVPCKLEVIKLVLVVFCGNWLSFFLLLRVLCFAARVEVFLLLKKAAAISRALGIGKSLTNSCKTIMTVFWQSQKKTDEKMFKIFFIKWINSKHTRGQLRPL